eukprot:scaffold5127_cov64-Phaeocystis_antarctica.AAC.11
MTWPHPDRRSAHRAVRPQQPPQPPQPPPPCRAPPLRLARGLVGLRRDDLRHPLRAVVVEALGAARVAPRQLQRARAGLVQCVTVHEEQAVLGRTLAAVLGHPAVGLLQRGAAALEPGQGQHAAGVGRRGRSGARLLQLGLQPVEAELCRTVGEAVALPAEEVEHEEGLQWLHPDAVELARRRAANAALPRSTGQRRGHRAEPTGAAVGSRLAAAAAEEAPLARRPCSHVPTASQIGRDVHQPLWAHQPCGEGSGGRRALTIAAAATRLHLHALVSRPSGPHALVGGGTEGGGKAARHLCVIGRHRITCTTCSGATQLSDLAATPLLLISEELVTPTPLIGLLGRQGS